MLAVFSYFYMSQNLCFLGGHLTVFFWCFHASEYKFIRGAHTDYGQYIFLNVEFFVLLLTLKIIGDHAFP